MTPLRVTATMSEPIVYRGDGMHLDGPLAWAAFMQRTTPADRLELPPIDATEWVEDEDLPLARVTVKDGPLGWVWAASAVHADWQLHSVVELRKKPPIHQMTRYTTSPSFHTSLGHMKAWDLKLPARFANYLVWYAHGDAKGVRELLTRVPSLGHKSRHGNGRVLRWSVEEWEHDWSVEREGRLTRRMPAAYRPTTPPSRATLRVPYHHRSRACLIVEPAYEELVP